MAGLVPPAAEGPTILPRMVLHRTRGNLQHGCRLQWQIGSRKVTPMRAMTITIPVLMLVSVAASAQEQGKAPAGQTPPSTAPAGGTAIPQAPVGHRQPTQGTLPPAVRKEEDAKRQPADPLGPIPNICRNC